MFTKEMYQQMVEDGAFNSLKDIVGGHLDIIIRQTETSYVGRSIRCNNHLIFKSGDIKEKCGIIGKLCSKIIIKTLNGDLLEDGSYCIRLCVEYTSLDGGSNSIMIGTFWWDFNEKKWLTRFGN